MNVPESMSHEQAVELLPWLVNGSLDEHENEVVRAHARACVICRRELSSLEQLQDSVSTASSVSLVPEPDMRNINARIDALIDRRNRGRKILLRLHGVFDSPWRIAFAAQTLVLVVLAGVLLWPEPRGGEFETLTQPQNLPDGQYLRVVFTPDLQQSQLTAMLDRHELTIVDGPSNRGVYTLRVANPAVDNEGLWLSLQEHPDVLFAQPVIVGADR